MTNDYMKTRDQAAEAFLSINRHDTTSCYQFMRQEREDAQAMCAKLAEALEKIADPRKRDHREPDKYTEVGCMMNMADEALAEYQTYVKERE